MSILQEIFTDYYEELKYLLRPRKSVMDNVERMIHCRDHSYGGAYFGCPDCGTQRFVPFTCKSRFCTSCGSMYNQHRSLAMSSKLISCIHRHCVFTIPEELRSYSGFVCVLHTFGRDLKWNPHIHVLISEGAAGNITPWRVIKHFDYNFLRNAFCKVLLDSLSHRIGSSFKKVKNEIYKNHLDGFYVRAKPNQCTPDITIKYINRYLGRPVIATSRIDSYNGETVVFHYKKHEDDSLVTESIPALDFIKRLIIHIPEKHFKMVRYYGIYAKHHKQEKNLRKVLSTK